MSDTPKVERLMKRCQIGVFNGRNALAQAHNLMAECYGTLGALVQERDRLVAVVKMVAAADGPDDWLDAVTAARAELERGK